MSIRRRSVVPLDRMERVVDRLCALVGELSDDDWDLAESAGRELLTDLHLAPSD